MRTAAWRLKIPVRRTRRRRSGPEVGGPASAASTEVWAARALLLPKLQVSGGYTVVDEDVQLDIGAGLPPEASALFGELAPIEVQPQTWWQASATVVQPLVDLDGWATVRAADAARDVARASADGVRSQVRAGVARAFHGLYLARERVAVEFAAVQLVLVTGG